MPVIGHALAAIVIAQETGARRAHVGVGPNARALWMPAIVGLSYLPDFATQIAVVVGYRAAQAFGHSLLFAAVAGVIFGWLWARFTGARVASAIVLAIGTILLHDFFDLWQDVEREPLWPFSERQVGFDWLIFTDRLWGELVVFGVPFVVYEAWRLRRRRSARPGPLDEQRASRAVRWIARGLVALVIVSAVTLLQLRRERTREFRQAEELLRAGKPAEALVLLDRASRWPAAAGSYDIRRGEAYERLGNLAEAEAAFLRAYELQPKNFWSVAVLAEFYASHGTNAERRKRAAPYVEELERRFGTHASYPSVAASLERNLARGR